jgi:hypothetical protein
LQSQPLKDDQLYNSRPLCNQRRLFQTRAEFPCTFSLAVADNFRILCAIFSLNDREHIAPQAGSAPELRRLPIASIWADGLIFA